MKDYLTERIRRPGAVGKETVQGGMVLPTGRLSGALNDSADAVASQASNPAVNQGNEIYKAGLSETAVEAEQENLQALRDAFQHDFPSTSSSLLFFLFSSTPVKPSSLSSSTIGALKRAESPAKVSTYGVKEDGLYREGMAMPAIELPSSLSFSHMNPVGCPIAGPPEAVLVYESLQESRLISVALLPVHRQPLGCDR
jgi:hypothetical protein